MALNAVMKPEKIALLKNLTKFGKAIENGLINLDSIYRMVQRIKGEKYEKEDVTFKVEDIPKQQKWQEVLQFMQKNPKILMSLIPQEEMQPKIKDLMQTRPLVR